LIELRIGTGSCLSRIWQWTLRFWKMQRITQLPSCAPWITQTIPGIKSPNFLHYACFSTHLFLLQ
jgi:hypothetical protein